MILLPSSPAPSSIAVRPVSVRNDLRPGLGGPTLRLNRLGDRWAFDVELPPMSYDDARSWIADLTRARSETVGLVWPQPGLCLRGRSGTVLVSGGSQAGTTLNVDGGKAGYRVGKGQFVSVATSGRKFLHMVTADAVFDSDGEASIAIDPMLRRSPADNDPVEIEAPVIEGFIEGDGQAWSVDAAHHVGLSFTIIERE